MKRVLILLLLVVLLGLWVGDLALQDSGYLLLSYQNTTLETSLWVGLLLLGLFTLSCYLVIRLVMLLLSGPAAIRLGLKRRQVKRAARFSQKGTIDLLEGHWSEAQKKLTKAGNSSEIPLLNYLVAARAAAENNDDASARELLNMAQRQAPGANLAMALAHADLDILQGHYQQAIGRLEPLRNHHPKHRQLHRVLQQAFLAQENWIALAALMPVLKKLKVAPLAQLDVIEEKVLLHSMAEIEEADDDQSNRLPDLKAMWKEASNTVVSRPDLCRHYVELMLKMGQRDTAERALFTALSTHWDDGLVELYGRIITERADQQLAIGERWQKLHDKDATLMLTLGRLALANQLWGRARSYFQDSLKLKPSAEAHAELARLLAHLGEDKSSLDHGYKAQQEMARQLPDLPLPDPAQLGLSKVN